uniref:Major facilitator superfamily (MFS) profile domain-containing protein n=1 Tax=Bionectria ochroleuca TaxID=29856 RepID=A0A8H7MY83_BIOOC
MSSGPEDQPQRHRALNVLHRVLDELGLAALYRAPFDVKLLCIQRFVRLYAYGATALVLVPLLHELGISQSRIGLFMTLTLIGDAGISLVLSLVADVVGRRAILVLGAFLMVLSGVVFATFHNFWLLLLAAIVGVLSANGNEIGPFRAVEESALAHLVEPSDHSDLFAWHCVLGYSGTATGIVSCGWVLNHLLQALSWSTLDAYRAVFYTYAILGLVKVVFALCMTQAVEAPAEKAKQISRPQLVSGVIDEESPLLAEPSEVQTSKSKLRRSLRPKVSRESLSFLPLLCALIALDSFGSGLVPISWVSYYFRTRFDIPDGQLGSIFFSASIFNAISTLFASSLAKRIGNVKTMVFTHLPSSVFLALTPLPNEAYWAITLLILRSCSQSMDTAPRSAFIASILLPGERTAVIGFINVLKTVAQGLGPLVTGVLAENNAFWVAFVTAGAIKISYDFGLLVSFQNYQRPANTDEEEEE